MKRFSVWLMLLLTLLLLTACHVDHDPWPTGEELASATATQPPVFTQSPTQIPTQAPQPTQVPGGSEAPGING